jgi:hypothetical protein
MKALSIQQPRAWAIIYADKDIENRTWNTHFRGTFAVHASGTLMRDAELPRRSLRPSPEELITSAIIGFVDLIDVVKGHHSKWFQGPIGFVLADPRPLRSPVPCKGKLGFWEIPPDVLRRCRL